MSAVEHCCLTIMRSIRTIRREGQREREGEKKRRRDQSFSLSPVSNVFLGIHFDHQSAGMSSNTETTTTTQTIVRDYFHWRLIAQTLTQDRLCLLVRQIGYDCERTFTSQEPVFRFSCSTSTLIQLRMIHYEIGKELFRDGNITWTRIITFISFSALLTERVLEKQCQNRELIIDSFIDWTTNFIETDLHAWLENEGYWVS